MKKFNLLFVAIFFVINGISQNVTLEDAWLTYKFYPSSLDDIASMKDGESYTLLLPNNNIEKYSYKSGKKTSVLFSLSQLKDTDTKPTKIENYTFSDNENKILISSDKQQIYRHSFKANYFVWDIAKQFLTNISTNGKQQLAMLSPDGNKVAFVRDNNIFIYDLTNNTETQVTSDGKFNFIINGAPDWVYEEEFSFSKAFSWSPDGKNIAFMRFDETNVKEYSMPMYGTLYPTEYKYKYPKAGETNSKVTLHVYNVELKKTINVDCGNDTDQYIPRLMWTNTSGVLSFVRMNRLQNKFELFVADAESGVSLPIYTEENKTYIEITDNLFFTEDGKYFFNLSDKSGYNHIYMYDLHGNLISQVTNGNWDVDAIKGFDAKKNIVYYTSSEVSPLQRNLYSIGVDGKNKKRLTLKDGTNDVSFSTNYKYFINDYSNATTPNVYTLYDANGKEIRVLDDNADLVTKINDSKFSKKEFFKFKTSDGVELNGWMLKPLNFDSNKKYPVLMSVYGGPGSQEVLDRWDYYQIWYQHLASKGYIIVSVDNRGTGARGADFKKITYLNLGKVETIDQIEAAKYLGTLNYVDAGRIGIWGWSFGGYLSTLCLEKGAGVFKMAVAVAPVTNWRYYDSIYTERYNGLPKDNAEGYDDNSPINHTKKIKGKYLLCHGTADDNVHFQNSMELVTKLVDSNVQFEMQFYPNSNHGIYAGRNTRYHLFSRLTTFISDNL
ncbi:MAG: S9 family peptidase [Bacteroidetes bacterium]|nr:S9 family peptidase [Bacteroidota bacterium]